MRVAALGLESFIRDRRLGGRFGGRLQWPGSVFNWVDGVEGSVGRDPKLRPAARGDLNPRLGGSNLGTLSLDRTLELSAKSAEAVIQ